MDGNRCQLLCLLSVTGRWFPVFMRNRFYPLSSSWLPIRMERGGLFQECNISHMNCKQHIPVPFSSSTERVGEQPSEIAVRRDTLARVCGWSDFWGASSQLLTWSVRPGDASISCCSSSFRGDECCCYSSRRPIEGLHGVHLPASTSYIYIEQTHKMSHVNGATDALSIGPSARYTLFFIFVHVSLLFTAYASSYTHMHIHVITYIALFFWIKLKLKMPKFLTEYGRRGHWCGS
jgi:hypothetical protein